MLKHAKNQRYALEVPEGCVELTEEEQYYDGGWLNFLAGCAMSVAGVALTIVATTTNNNTLRDACNMVSAGLLVASVIMGTGAVNAVFKAGAGITTKQMANAAYALSMTPADAVVTVIPLVAPPR